MEHYTEQLILDTIAYYHALDGRTLSPEEAGQYLDSLADFYECLKESVRHDFSFQDSNAARPSGGLHCYVSGRPLGDPLILVL